MEIQKSVRQTMQAVRATRERIHEFMGRIELVGVNLPAGAFAGTMQM